MVAKKEESVLKVSEKAEAPAMKSAEVGYTEKPLMSTSDAKPVEAKTDDANKFLVKAVRSFEGVEGDKGPASEPFSVSRQRYADLKANGLVELVEE
ncbi:hypothetical protein LRX75_11765 [Rhizobium sp. DKSPLA3]|uniref:Uncharacterized protein n=1 Tax=Rhizobium quercicola TaxID=2901226 RepID=A0A9X1NU33_9HYPH|nr:hypothetical protein [Rhizobium quercicola]MCD7109714.1 hypothetical protein [Rhizobium quercicola]